MRLFLFVFLSVSTLSAIGSSIEISARGRSSGTVIVKHGAEWYLGANVWALKKRGGSPLESVRAVRLGENFCALNLEGHIECWDTSDAFFNGVPGRKIGQVPLSVTRFEGYCVSSPTNEIYCMKSFLEDAAVKYRYEPVDVRALGPIAKVSGSATHVCVLTDSGAIYCWGENFAGKLGMGGFPFLQRPEDDTDWSVGFATFGLPFPTNPVRLNTHEHVFTQVSVFANTSCALSDEPRENVYCWGRVGPIYNTYDDFKAFSAVTAAQPVAVDLGNVPGRRLNGVVAGPVQSFGWTAQGAVYWWGDYADQTFDDRLGKKAHYLGSLPLKAHLRTLVPVGGEVCAIVSIEEVEKLYCSRRPLGRSTPSEFFPVSLEDENQGELSTARPGM